MNNKTKVHTQYKLKDGKTVVPGTTTIINLLDKPAIHFWIANITKQGYDWTKYRDDKADIGSLAHAMILADLQGEKCDTSAYSQDQIDQAETAYLQYLSWADGKTLEPILVEIPLVSETYQFGGTPDYYGMVNGELCLADYKTGGIYKEAYIQTCAYVGLLQDNGYKEPQKIIILGIPRSEKEEFTEKTYTSYTNGWEAFLCLRRLYDLLKKI